MKSLLLAGTSMLMAVGTEGMTAVNMWTCIKDSDCAAYGDAQAQCLNNGQCLCSPGYSSFKNGQAAGSELFTCISDVEPTTVTNQRWIDVVMSLSFGQHSTCGDATVLSWSDLFLHHVESIIRQEPTTRTTPEPSHIKIPLWQNITQINHFCTPFSNVVTTRVTGIDTVIQGTLRIGDLYNTLPTFETQLATRLNNDPVLYEIFGRPQGDNAVDAVTIEYSYAHTTTGSQAICPVDITTGAYLSASFIPDLLRTETPAAEFVKCRFVKCTDGYTYSESGCAATPVPLVASSDDEISGGAIAGIVVGCTLVLCIIIIIIYCCCCKKDDDQNAAAEPEKKAKE
eukprot:TRINITY_DN4638_c0_g1_i1.p1 TRINITY_DN4638_c0_g1~~TRINITY_DN4638_c0_g1_i1.p1  ORF type:complete len:341 (+),score=52.94 TRINITY_DN4638_c0_g1_i1:43-1065(+)